MIDEFKLREEIFENSLRIAAEKHRRLWVKVELDSGDEGDLWIENGRILHAVVGKLSGIEAFRTIIGSKYIKILSFKGFSDDEIPLSVNVALNEALRKARKQANSEDKTKEKGEPEMINNLNNIVKKLKN